MKLTTMGAFYIALAIIGVASVIQGQVVQGIVALVAAIGIWLNDLSRQPEYRWLAFSRYLALGVIAFLVVIAFSVR